MGAGLYALLDVGLCFGVLIAFSVQQLISTSRAKQRRLEREKARRGESG